MYTISTTHVHAQNKENLFKRPNIRGAPKRPWKKKVMDTKLLLQRMAAHIRGIKMKEARKGLITLYVKVY